MPSVRNVGPFVNLAVLCRARYEQPDESVDLIGILKHVLTLDSPYLDRVDARELQTVAVVSLHGGELRGGHTLAVRTRYPGGIDGPMVSRLVEFSDDVPQVTVQVPLKIELERPGEYCVDIVFDRTLLSRITLTAAKPASAPGRRPKEAART